jgi:SAM-dependent methyltransferase
MEARMNEAWQAHQRDADDFSHYHDPEYVWPVWACFVNWSGPALKQCIPIARDSGVKSVLDFGAGVGATTALLAAELPDAQVVYQNLRGQQWDAAKELFGSLGLGNVVMVEEATTGTDCVVTFEVMEHFREPIKQAQILVGPDSGSRLYFDNSTFSVDWLGHYLEYSDGKSLVPAKKFKRQYNRALRSWGWHSLPTRFWNNRPAVWERE